MELYCRRVIASIVNCNPSQVQVTLHRHPDGVMEMNYIFDDDMLHDILSKDINSPHSLFRIKLEPFIGGTVREYELCEDITGTDTKIS